MKLINKDAFAVMNGMKAQSVDIVISDPPYDMVGKQAQTMIAEMFRISRGGVILFCPPENQFLENPDQICFWMKPISTKNTSRRYSRFVEMIQIQGTTVWNNERHWSQYTNIFHDLVEDAKVHPFAKPIPLMRRLVLNHTNHGQVVFDPFAGSGSTGVACKETGRDFIGVEIDSDRFRSMQMRLGEGVR